MQTVYDLETNIIYIIDEISANLCGNCRLQSNEEKCNYFRVKLPGTTISSS